MRMKICISPVLVLIVHYGWMGLILTLYRLIEEKIILVCYRRCQWFFFVFVSCGSAGEKMKTLKLLPKSSL